MKEIKYIKCGDYLIPDLKLSDEPIPKHKTLSKYGRMRLIYLRDYHNEVYNEFLSKGTLENHLSEVDEAAYARCNIIVAQMMKLEGVTENLKATDQMRWVQMMNYIRAMADEIVRRELIYM